MGRPRKPTRLKKLEGNPGKRPLPDDEPTPPSGAQPPDYLDAAAKKEWSRLAPHMERIGLLTISDQAAFAIYCQAVSDVVSLTRRIRKKGQTITTPNGAKQRNPDLITLREAKQTITRMAGQFGLTPSGRSGLSVADMPDDLDEFLK